MANEANGPKKSYIPVSRGVLQYFPAYSSPAIKVYFWFLLKAGYNGPSKGVAEFSYPEAAKALNLSTKTIRNCVRELAIGHFRHTKKRPNAPPFIKIVKIAEARGKKNRILILKAKMSVKDFQDIESGSDESVENGETILEDLARRIAESKSVHKILQK